MDLADAINRNCGRQRVVLRERRGEPEHELKGHLQRLVMEQPLREERARPAAQRGQRVQHAFRRAPQSALRCAARLSIP
jgi:hypothetical protein